MDVRIDVNYSASELQEVIDALLSTGVITPVEAIPPHELQALQIDFLTINELLRPAFDRLASYSIDSRKGWFDQSETDFFYKWFTLQLLRKCPLNQYEVACQDELASFRKQDRFILQAGNHSASVYYHHLNHPEFITQLVNTVNLLLQQHGFDLAYYEISSYDETALFLPLTLLQYQHLLTNRLVSFADVDYPEIAAWRKTLRKEDLPF